jgi:hypothetical protein
VKYIYIIEPCQQVKAKFWGVNMNVFALRSSSLEMNNSTEDLETIVNLHLGNSLSSLDIDKVFHDDTSSGHRCVKGTREMRQRMFLQQFQPQHGGGNATGSSVSSVFLNKSITIPEDEVLLDRPGSLAKFDRASTLGSFSVFTGSFDGSLRDIPETVDGNSDQTDGICGSGSSNNDSSKKPETVGRQFDIGCNYGNTLEQDKCKKSSSSDIDGTQPDSVVNSRESFGHNACFNRESSERTMMVSNVSDDPEHVPQSETSPSKTSERNNKIDINAMVENEKDMVCRTSGSDNHRPGSPIVAPHEHDVLMGRGGRNNQWSGNELLRSFAFELSGTYSTASKRAKPSIAWILVTKMRALQPPGRYVFGFGFFNDVCCETLFYSVYYYLFNKK